MIKPRIWYRGEPYQSHNRVGRVYKSILAGDYEIVEDPKLSDVVILHLQPWDYQTLYERAPWLEDRYVISYCTWEADKLPAKYKRSLDLVQEVWTCSSYCAGAICPHHPKVACIPHVIERDTTTKPLDDILVRRLVEYDENFTYFLSFGDTLGSRKNTFALVHLFETLSESMPEARLIVISAPDSPHLHSTDQRVFHLPIRFSDSQLNALYSLCDAYVSAHHSEGWGLTLSDAIFFDKPIIGTGYSGNLEFTTSDNSFLIDATEVLIREDQLYHLFTTQMKWAEPDYEHLASIMHNIYRDIGGDLCRNAAHEARKQLVKFSRENIRDLMMKRIAEI